jgi:AcrR family transcriptional regulator
MGELRTEPRQRRSQQSIGAILDAAERLIHEHGQVSFTANELANEAGMSIGRVYYWYPDIPSVVAALAERAADGMLSAVAKTIEKNKDLGLEALLQKVVASMCDHVNEHPATIALCLTGGDQSYGSRLKDGMRERVSERLKLIVADIPDFEAELVAETAVGLTLGMLGAYVRVEGAQQAIRDELVYVLCAWLHSRYPGPDDPVWGDPSAIIQPSRARQATAVAKEIVVHPALSPRVSGG